MEQEGAAQEAEQREATPQPSTEVRGQASPESGESSETVVPLERKKRRLVKLGDVTPSNEVPPSIGVTVSGVPVVSQAKDKDHIKKSNEHEQVVERSNKR